MGKIIKLDESTLNTLIKKRLDECMCEKVNEGNSSNTYLAKLKWEKSTPEEKVVFLNLNNFSDNLANKTFEQLPIGIKKLVALKMDKQTVTEDIEEESTVVYWRDVEPSVELKQIGNSYVVDGKGVYWLGGEKNNAIPYLDNIIKINKLKNIKPIEKSISEDDLNTNNSDEEFTQEEYKFLFAVLRQVEADDEIEENVLMNLKNKIQSKFV